MSTSESWGVNGHITRCTGPVSVWSCGFGWCPTEGYETEIIAAPWALRLGKGLYFFTNLLYRTSLMSIKDSS